ncbi:hypothetical protein CYMTET_19190 [Cymbomonas tetramitiformis]|uniref:Phosphoglycolate phosphatase n=1 Tax=Cymbomonas tetramitiformis TaxID=36881 RepID=A0AAE0L550_9CHLO|nr:hypothetical protein CYMTET_19190 [Cymbomonas tetramitiformis]
MSETIKAVFFDVDGTLAATTSLGFSATNAILRENGYQQISEAEYKVGTKYTTPERLAWHATGGLDGGNTTDAVGLKLGAKFDDLYVGLVSLETAGFFPGFVAFTAKSYTELVWNFKQSVEGVPKFELPSFEGRQLTPECPERSRLCAAGMKELCEHLQKEGCHIGALSNACGAYVVAVLAANGVSDVFHPQLGADDVPMPKPAPDGLLQCCQMVDAAPSECIYIGDAPSDGFAARAAGMHSIGVTWGSHERASCESAFDELVDDVQALLEAVSARTSSAQMPQDRKSSSTSLASMHQGSEDGAIMNCDKSCREMFSACTQGCGGCAFRAHAASVRTRSIEASTKILHQIQWRKPCYPRWDEGEGTAQHAVKTGGRCGTTY